MDEDDGRTVAAGVLVGERDRRWSRCVPCRAGTPSVAGWGRSTRDRVDAWWRGAPRRRRASSGARSRSQHPHGRLGCYAGWYVAWRDERRARLRAVRRPQADEVASLGGEPPLALQAPDFWQAFARPARPGGARPVDARLPRPRPRSGRRRRGRRARPTSPTLRGIRRRRGLGRVWFDRGPRGPSVALVEDGRLVAAASLNVLDGSPRDIGVAHRAGPRARSRPRHRVGRHAARRTPSATTAWPGGASAIDQRAVGAHRPSGSASSPTSPSSRQARREWIVCGLERRPLGLERRRCRRRGPRVMPMSSSPSSRRQRV